MRIRRVNIATTLRHSCSRTNCVHAPSRLNRWTDSLFQALNGFLLILTCDGEVFFATHSIESYLGFHQVSFPFCFEFTINEVPATAGKKEVKPCDFIFQAQLPKRTFGLTCGRQGVFREFSSKPSPRDTRITEIKLPYFNDVGKYTSDQLIALRVDARRTRPSGGKRIRITSRKREVDDIFIDRECLYTQAEPRLALITR